MKHLPFALLTPGNHPPRAMDPARILRASNSIGLNAEGQLWLDDNLHDILYCRAPIFLDFETRGLNPITDPNFALMGLGLCTEEHLPIYIGVEPSSTEVEQKVDREALLLLCNQLRYVPSLVAHNVSFDGMVMAWALASYSKLSFPSLTVQDFDHLFYGWEVCTYGLYRALASEDWLGQKHGLKDAMEDLLGWTDTNEQRRDEWLVTNGWSRKHSAGGEVIDKPMKGEMWRVPMDILGHYCLLDCEATMLLYIKVLKPVADRFQGLTHFHKTYFMDLVKHVTWQKLRGVTVQMGGDTGLLQYRAALKQEIKDLRKKFFLLDEVKCHIDAFHQEKLETLLAVPPARYKAGPKATVEPKKYNISGKLSTTWQNWEEKRLVLSRAPIETSSYIKWDAKVDELKQAIADFYESDNQIEEEDNDGLED